MQNQSPSPVRARVFVSGLVQGVGYRYSTMDRAQELGLGGWVRNLPDGRVEAVFEGDKKAVESAIDWCRLGPRGAAVSDLAWEYETPKGDRTFEIRH